MLQSFGRCHDDQCPNPYLNVLIDGANGANHKAAVSGIINGFLRIFPKYERHYKNICILYFDRITL